MLEMLALVIAVPAGLMLALVALGRYEERITRDASAQAAPGRSGRPDDGRGQEPAAGAARQRAA